MEISLVKKVRYMNAYELLKCNKNLIRVMLDNNISLDDSQHIEMYKEYIKMKREGEKVAYIADILAIKYQMTARNVFRIVHKLEKELNI